MDQINTKGGGDSAEDLSGEQAKAFKKGMTILVDISNIDDIDKSPPITPSSNPVQG